MRTKKSVCKICGSSKDNYGDDYGDYCSCCNHFFKSHGSFDGAVEFRAEVELHKVGIRKQLDKIIQNRA